MTNPWQEAPIFLHIGMPKCATTYFQSIVFPSHPSIQYLGTLPSHERMRDAPAYEFLHHLKRREELTFDQSHLAALLPRPDPTKVAVLSDEDLGSTNHIDRTIKAKRLRETFGNARILVTIRNPVDWVESWYLFEMRKIQRFVRFEDWMDRQWRKFDTSIVRTIQYRQLIELYADQFGRDRVKISVYEDLKETPQEFLADIMRVIGVDVDELPASVATETANVRMPSIMLKVAETTPFLYNLRRVFPPSLRGKIRKASQGITGESRLDIPQEWRERITRFCADDLRRLSDEWDLDLGSKGYDITP